MGNQGQQQDVGIVTTGQKVDWRKVGVVVAAAGSSRRFGHADKLLTDLDGIPVFCHCIRTFLVRILPVNIVVVVPMQQLEAFRHAATAAALPGRIRFVQGGARRQDSVRNGLDALPPTVELVAVQDAARPWTTLELLEACVASAVAEGSGVAARPVTDTIKQADAHGNVQRTLDRSGLFAAETPQVFARPLLERAYAQLGSAEVTDDAQALERLGLKVALVCHSGTNPKVTFPGDLC